MQTLNGTLNAQTTTTATSELNRIHPFGSSQRKSHTAPRRKSASVASKAVRAQAVIASASTECDVRFELVSRLRAAIAAGTYRISSEEIAGKMMTSMLG